MRIRRDLSISAVAASAAVAIIVSILQPAVWREALSGGLATAAGALIVAGLMTRRSISRLDDLRQEVERRAEGDLGEHFPLRAGDDLAPLVRGLDDSFQRLKRRMNDLRRDRARLEAILAGMVEGVLVVNEVGQVQLVNDAAQRLLRLDGSAVGRRYVELVRHPEVTPQIDRALLGESPPGLELTLGQYTLIARSAPVASPGGNGAVLVLHDISDLRRADRIRRDFVANVSHELRTPLTAIRGYVEALLDAPPDEVDTRRFLEIIARHSSRMERLVKDLLRLARLDAGQELLDLVPCSVDAIFDGVASELQPSLDARRQTIDVRIVPEAAVVTADPAKLHDIFKNLVENASNYSPERSRITLEAEPEDDWIVLRVLDQGTGIPAADLQRIFERFYRVDKARSRETGGTGLGLSIVRHLAELHRGHVRASNRPEGGAVFSVRLPRAAAPAQVESPAVTATQPLADF